MPGITKALRQDETLNVEAMATFLKMNHTFVLHEENDWGFGDMKKQAILGITKVKIIVECVCNTAEAKIPKN